MLGILYRVCISSLLNILHLDISLPLRRYFPRRWLGWSLLAPGPDQDCPTLPTLLAGPGIGHLSPWSWSWVRPSWSRVRHQGP